MTPFGKKVRSLRAERGLTQKQMAESIGVSPAYLSALEMGKKGRPSFALVQRIITYFNIIWDDAEELIELAGISHPRIVIDTSNLSADATSFANRLSREIKKLTDSDIALLTTLLDRAKQKNKPHGI
ncbi:MAG: helix-turn-helix transcriptional regulator [Bartonella sp.]|nr:helix-turn-helix transcriptional regulator [Bartonella sp.]